MKSTKQNPAAASVYLNSLCPSDAKPCPLNSRLDRVFRHWLIKTQQSISTSLKNSQLEMEIEHRLLHNRQLSWVRTYLRYMQGMRNMVFKDIRPCNILHCVENLSVSAAAQVISVYKKLSDFAYYDCEGLCAERYSLKIPTPHRNTQVNDFDRPVLDDQTCQEIKSKSGSIGADLAATMVCTGISPAELAANAGISQPGLPKMVIVRSTWEPIKTRRVPVVPEIIPPFSNALTYLSDLHAQGKSQAYIQARIRSDTLPFRTEAKPFSQLARNTFCDRLLDHEVSPVMINILLGTSSRYGCQYQLTYFHPSERRLLSSVEGLSLTAKNKATSPDSPD